MKVWCPVFDSHKLHKCILKRDHYEVKTTVFICIKHGQTFTHFLLYSSVNAKTRYTQFTACLCILSIPRCMVLMERIYLLFTIIIDVVFLQRSSIPSQRTLHSTHVKTLTIHPRLSATCVLNAKCAPLGKKKNQCKRNGILMLASRFPPSLAGLHVNTGSISTFFYKAR